MGFRNERFRSANRTSNIYQTLYPKFFSNHSPFGYLQCVTNNVSNTTMGQHITKPNNFTWTKSHAMHALFTNQTGYLQVRFVFLIIFFFGNILSIENAMDACKKAAEIMIVWKKTQTIEHIIKNIWVPTTFFFFSLYVYRKQCQIRKMSNTTNAWIFAHIDWLKYEQTKM